ncbi:tetratricopeptide repeat protein [Paenibacillus nanensis]|uniref:Tetratricopeptide repeat protein n=1 Tax=Paenibacillus nanensis TaxID=393251 RepID=A0A3A1UZ11_9BACL|nr:tetratricopeptide repeat protein [Paenibacillus nanensis]RIX53728.1 tetratricopeptide repeat protein [Paenibacillus nanensis]
MDGESCIRKAYEYIFNSDFEAAIYWFEQAIAAEPENAAYYHKCAVSCARSGKWTKAKVYADVAEKLEPDNEEYRFHAQIIQSRLLLAEAQSLISDSTPNLNEAAERLRHAVALDPLSFDAYYTLAMVCQASGQLDEALDHAREALRLDPNHSAARRLFADISRKRRIARIRNTIRRK